MRTSVIPDLIDAMVSDFAALSDLSAVRVAVDQELADLDAPLAGAREVAFFPPMTGG